MTKTYELPNEKMIMADVDEKHHMATVSVYALDDLVEAVNKKDVLDKLRAEISDLADSDAYGDYQQGFNFGLMRAAQIIDKYRNEVSE